LSMRFSTTLWRRMEVEVKLHTFLTWALAADCRLQSPAALYPAPILYEVGWVPESVWMWCRGSNHSRPACSQSLYWLSYRGSHV
jgi:hypothetical protein